MNTDILFENEEEKVATERVLAAYRVKNINQDIDTYVTEILKYAKCIDDLLEQNNFPKRYLDKVSSLNEDEPLSLDIDLNKLDFRVKELIEDYIKRINTRVELIKENDRNLKYLEENYNLTNINLEEELKKAKLTMEEFA